MYVPIHTPEMRVTIKSHNIIHTYLDLGEGVDEAAQDVHQYERALLRGDGAAGEQHVPQD